MWHMMDRWWTGDRQEMKNSSRCHYPNIRQPICPASITGSTRCQDFFFIKKTVVTWIGSAISQYDCLVLSWRWTDGSRKWILVECWGLVEAGKGVAPEMILIVALPLLNILYIYCRFVRLIGQTLFSGRFKITHSKRYVGCLPGIGEDTSTVNTFKTISHFSLKKKCFRL